MPEREQRPSSLPKAIQNSKTVIVQELASLITATQDAIAQPSLDNNGQTTVEIVAALGAISELARAGANIFSNSETIIFEKPQPEDPNQTLTSSPLSDPSRITRDLVETTIVQQPVVHTDGKSEISSIPPTQEKDKKPTTYAELLAKKVDEKLLPPNKETVSVAEILKLLLSLGGGKDTLKAMDPNHALSREESIAAIIQVLQFRRSTSFSPTPRDNWTKSELMYQHTGSLNADQCRQWTSEIGQDWSQKTSFTNGDKNAIQGLKRLRNVLQK